MSIFNFDGRGVQFRDFSISYIDSIIFDIDFVNICFEIESETLFLSDSKKVSTIVLSNGFAFQSFGCSFFDWEFLHEKLLDWYISDETKTLRIWAICVGKSDFFCYFSYLQFFQLSNRENSFAELVLTESRKKISLIFIVINSTK